MSAPKVDEFPPYFSRYISLVQASSPSAAIQVYSEKLIAFYTSLSEDKADYRYAAGKWTVKELLQHVIDAERVFSYRILCIARNDKTPLPSFNEDEYAAHSNASNRSLASLKAEFSALRRASDFLIASLQEAQLREVGTSSNLPVSANALCFILFGHLLHHQQILLERYLS